MYLVGSFVLVSLAGCGRGFFQSAEREPWRAEAELACLKSGAVKENAELVRINPISVPGSAARNIRSRWPPSAKPTAVLALPTECGRRAAWATGRVGRFRRLAPRRRPSSYPDSAMRQPGGYGAPSNGPISLSAPGVAQEEDDSRFGA